MSTPRRAINSPRLAELASILAVGGRLEAARDELEVARAPGDAPAAARALELHTAHVTLALRARDGTLTRALTTKHARAARLHAAVDRGPFSPRVRIAARVVLRCSKETAAAAPRTAREAGTAAWWWDAR